MRLADCDIVTRDVLDWKGFHLFHAPGSSCSQKTRIFLNLKGIEWTSHPIDLTQKENLAPYYMGINPRGLVPCLIHDGAVHIESNDILLYLESCFPDPPLIPDAQRESVMTLLAHEDELHLALRTVTFRFLFPQGKPPKSGEELDRYAATGSGTVGGVADAAKAHEIAYWRGVLNHGIPDDAARAAVAAFQAAFADLDDRLSRSAHILGGDLTMLDIAWLVYVNRMTLAGYPLAARHPHLARWALRLKDNPVIVRELAAPPEAQARMAAHQAMLQAAGQDLATVCGLNG